MVNSLWVYEPTGELVLGKMTTIQWFNRHGHIVFDEHGKEYYYPAKDYSYWCEL